MAELVRADDCCAPATQAGCCAPSEKEACCVDGECGCTAEEGAGDLRDHAGHAIVRAAKPRAS